MNVLGSSQRLTLSLRNNQIHTIHTMAFSQPGRSLKYLDISENYVTDLSFLFAPCSSVFTLSAMVHAARNPLICDCHFYSILTLGFYNFQGMCSSPAQLEGVNVKSVYGMSSIQPPFSWIAEHMCPLEFRWSKHCMGS